MDELERKTVVSEDILKTVCIYAPFSLQYRIPRISSCMNPNTINSMMVLSA